MDERKLIRGKKLYLFTTIIALIALLGAGLFYYQRHPFFSATRGSSPVLDESTAQTKSASTTNAASTLTSSSPVEITSLQEQKDLLRVVVYNTHPWKKCKSGDTIAEVSRKLADKLIETGIRSVFLNNSHNEVKDSYKISRNLIESTVTSYKGKILLDIMIDGTQNKKDILVYVAKGNPSYLKNADFAGRLVKQINALDKNASIAVVENNWVWNQDLSDNALTIMVGSQVPNDKINKGIEALSTALKNIENSGMTEQSKP